MPSACTFFSNALPSLLPFSPFPICATASQQTRAAFEEQLLRAVQGVREANHVLAEVGAFGFFRIVGGGEVDLDRLYSLRLEDALPPAAVALTVEALLLSASEVRRRERALARADRQAVAAARRRLARLTRSGEEARFALAIAAVGGTDRQSHGEDDEFLSSSDSEFGSSGSEGGGCGDGSDDEGGDEDGPRGERVRTVLAVSVTEFDDVVQQLKLAYVH